MFATFTFNVFYYKYTDTRTYVCNRYLFKTFTPISDEAP